MDTNTSISIQYLHGCTIDAYHTARDIHPVMHYTMLLASNSTQRNISVVAQSVHTIIVY